MSEHAAGLTNTSGNAHCPHCAVCHTPDETCIRALQRVLALYEQRQPPTDTGNDPKQPGDRLRAVGEYVASLKANLHPKEKCPHCFGSNEPSDQIDCADLPCMIGRDFHRPALEKVIQHIEALLVSTRPAVSEQRLPTFFALVEIAEAELARLALERGVSIDQLFPAGHQLPNAPFTLRALVQAANGGKRFQGSSVGWFDPNAAGCVRWKDGATRADFNEGDPIYCLSTVACEAQ